MTIHQHQGFIRRPLSLYEYDTSPEHKDPPDVRVPISSSDAKIYSGKLQSQITRRVRCCHQELFCQVQNDAMHGTKNKNKTKIREEAGSKDHNLCQNRHVKCTKSYEVEKRKRSWK